MKKTICLFFGLFIFVKILISQAKWPIPLFFPEYGVYLNLTNDVNLRDTAKIILSENTFFKIVLFDSHGKSYFESYVNNKLKEKGYYENSLDTLKKYSSSVIIDTRSAPIKVLMYFQPLRNGDWVVAKKRKLVRKQYKMGIQIN